MSNTNDRFREEAFEEGDQIDARHRRYRKRVLAQRKAIKKAKLRRRRENGNRLSS